MVWMKLDIGMYCFGVCFEEVEVFYQCLMYCKNVCQLVNIVSYFVCVDELECGVIEYQFDIFSVFCQGKFGQCFIVVFGGILLWLQFYFDWVCLGIILYGVLLLEYKFWGLDFGFQLVMFLIFSLIVVCDYKVGELVGYGGIWVSECDMCLGVVVMGYGDGYL